jgi:hypothetical protein
LRQGGRINPEGVFPLILYFITCPLWTSKWVHPEYQQPNMCKYPNMGSHCSKAIAFYGTEPNRTKQKLKNSHSSYPISMLAQIFACLSLLIPSHKMQNKNKTLLVAPHLIFCFYCNSLKSRPNQTYKYSKDRNKAWLSDTPIHIT